MKGAPGNGAGPAEQEGGGVQSQGEGRGGGAGPGGLQWVRGSLFDEVLHLLSAQEAMWPPCHGPDQAQLLLAVTQGHGLDPVGGTQVRKESGLHPCQEG